MRPCMIVSYIKHCIMSISCRYIDNASVILCRLLSVRVVASLSLPGGQDMKISSFSFFLISFFLIFPSFSSSIKPSGWFWLGDSPTREGPGYTTAFCKTIYKKTDRGRYITGLSMFLSSISIIQVNILPASEKKTLFKVQVVSYLLCVVKHGRKLEMTGISLI